MADPISRIPGMAPVIDPVAMTRALDAQAKVTGGASNYAAQNTLQATKNTEERRKAAHDLISLKNINAAQAALPTLRDMKRSDEDDEDERDDDPRHPRRKRRRSIPPLLPGTSR